MKKIFALLFAFYFIGCHNECDCVLFDDAIFVSYASLEKPDSVWFFLNDQLVCDGVIGFSSQTQASCLASTLQDSLPSECVYGQNFYGAIFQINLYECSVSKNCHSFDVDSAKLKIRVFHSDFSNGFIQIDSIPMLKKNFAYVVLPQKDSSFIWNFYLAKSKDPYSISSTCPSGFCLAEEYNDKMMCHTFQCSNPPSKENCPFLPDARKTGL